MANNASIGSFSKGAVGSAQVSNNGVSVNAKVEEFKKNVESFDNKVSSAKNVTIDLSVFLEDMTFKHEVEGSVAPPAETLEGPGSNIN